MKHERANTAVEAHSSKQFQTATCMRSTACFVDTIDTIRSKSAVTAQGQISIEVFFSSSQQPDDLISAGIMSYNHCICQETQEQCLLTEAYITGTH